jgi:hypothetical protein
LDFVGLLYLADEFEVVLLLIVLLMERLPFPLVIEAVDDVDLVFVVAAPVGAIRLRLAKVTIDGLGEFQTDGRFRTEEDFILIFL